MEKGDFGVENQIYGGVEDDILDLDGQAGTDSLVPYEIPPLRSSATYPAGDFDPGDREDLFQRKRRREDERNLQEEQGNEEDAAQSDAERAVEVIEDSPNSTSWQKRYEQKCKSETI